jgi:hypothetical protein
LVRSCVGESSVSYLKDVNLSDTFDWSILCYTTRGTNTYVQLDLRWILTISKYSQNVISVVFNIEKASWDMMPFRVVSRFLDPEDGTNRPVKMSATLPVDTASYASIL